MHNDKFLDYAENTVVFPSFDFPVEAGDVECDKLILFPLFSEGDKKTINEDGQSSFQLRRLVGLMIHPTSTEEKYYLVGTIRTPFMRAQDMREKIVRLPERTFCII
jgi:hypothetical protein